MPRTAKQLTVSRLGRTDLKALADRHPLLRDSRYGVLVSVPDEATARELERELQAGSQRVAEYLATLRARLSEVLVPDLVRLSEPTVTQAQLEATARARLLAEFGALTSAEVAERAGFTGKNAAQTAYRWRQQGRIFGVERNGETLHPSFQFDSRTGQPLPVIREILKVLRSADMSPWSIALWFTAPSGILDGRRPVDVLDDRELVLRAAEDAVAEAEF